MQNIIFGQNDHFFEGFLNIFIQLDTIKSSGRVKFINLTLDDRSISAFAI